jgi:arabinose-5-phosphate isomerase
MDKTNLPVCQLGTFLPDAISVMTSSKSGIAILVDKDNYPLGVFTDGDLRRVIEDDSISLKVTSLQKVVKAPPLTIHYSASMLEAEDKMKENRVKSLLAVNSEGILVGVVNILKDRLSLSGKKI